jgi:raffinose/stachyose/melibiose transport system substrate-binding protein
MKRYLGVLALAVLAAAPALAQNASGGPLVWALTGGDEKAYKQSVEEYDAAHPDAKATLQLFQNDPYKQKLLVALGSGSGPDVFFGWGGGILKSYIDAGDVVDLTPKLAADPGWKSRYLPSILPSVTFEGKIYGVPLNGTQPIVIFYNKKVLQEAGVQPPKTFEDILAMAPKLQAKGKAVLTLGGASKWTYLMYEEYLVDRIGGPQVFADVLAGKAGAWSNPAVLEANQKIQQMVKANVFVKGFTGITYDTGQATALLYTGRAAMQVMGTWDFPSMLASQPSFVKSGDLGWMAFPSVSGGKGDPADIVGGPANFYSVNAKGKHVDGAIDFLKTAVLSPRNVETLIQNGSIPPVTGLEDQIAKAPNSQWLSFVYDLVKKAPSFQLSWDQALPPAQADALLTNLDQLFLLQITPQQFSDNMTRTMQKQQAKR